VNYPPLSGEWSASSMSPIALQYFDQFGSVTVAIEIAGVSSGGLPTLHCRRSFRQHLLQA